MSDNGNPKFVSMGATALVDIIMKHNNHATATVEGAVAEVTRRVAKGCKQPVTQEWLVQVLTAYANVDTIPRKSTVAKRMAAEQAKAKPVKVTNTAKKQSTPEVKASTIARFAEQSKLSDLDWDRIFTAEAQESLARTYKVA